MKKSLTSLLLSLAILPVEAQKLSCASFMKAKPKTDVNVPFRYTDEGKATPIEWGFDLAWCSEDNLRHGITFAGKEIVDIVRVSFRPTDGVADGVLSNSQLNMIKKRANLVKKYCKAGVGININSDHETVDPWFNDATITTTARGQRWAKCIDLTAKQFKTEGLTNLVSISPFNEPDYGWNQGVDAYRKSDMRETCKSLKQDFDGVYDDVRICGGNTLNDDKAYEWWSYLKAYLDEGNTHQLAGNFDNYASFFEKVRAAGHHATADELHNTMEAMVGVEYGMQTGIWWGSADYTRSQFMKATYQGNPGQRLGYAEHRNNWTAASVYRHADGSVQGFGGTSERQAVSTKYNFVALDRPVWYDGERGRDYVMELPGGTGYQQGQTNAETLINIQGGEDIMPHINGTYKIVNRKTNKLMGFSASPSATDWTSVKQQANSNSYKYLQWNVTPIEKIADFYYCTLELNTGRKLMLDVLNWGLTSGTDIGVYPGGLGTNEHWYLQYAGNGAFYIRSRHNNLCIEVQGGSTTNGTNVRLATFDGSEQQQWLFIPTNVKPDNVAPDAPTNLIAEEQSNSVKLMWTASESTDLSGYIILRSDDGKDFYTLAKHITETCFVDNETNTGVQYTYKVLAEDKCFNKSECTPLVVAQCKDEKSQVLSYSFDETMEDATENFNHCALYGEQTFIEGKHGKAISLNGIDNFIQLPYTIANHNEITIAMWVNYRGGSTWQRIFDFGNSTNQYMFLTANRGTGLRFTINDGNGEQMLTPGKTLPTNSWHHIAITMGSEECVFYYDGARLNSTTKITIRPSDIKPVCNYIGRSQFIADPMFKGSIDDFQIINRALSAEEIATLYENTDGINPIANTASQSTITTAYDLQGRTVNDSYKGIKVKKGKKVL